MNVFSIVLTKKKEKYCQNVIRQRKNTPSEPSRKEIATRERQKKKKKGKIKKEILEF